MDQIPGRNVWIDGKGKNIPGLNLDKKRQIL